MGWVALLCHAARQTSRAISGLEVVPFLWFVYRPVPLFKWHRQLRGWRNLRNWPDRQRPAQLQVRAQPHTRVRACVCRPVPPTLWRVCVFSIGEAWTACVRMLVITHVGWYLNFGWPPTRAQMVVAGAPAQNFFFHPVVCAGRCVLCAAGCVPKASCVAHVATWPVCLEVPLCFFWCLLLCLLLIVHVYCWRPSPPVPPAAVSVLGGACSAATPGLSVCAAV